MKGAMKFPLFVRGLEKCGVLGLQIRKKVLVGKISMG